MAEKSTAAIGGDRFAIKKRLGGGGGGDVYRARDRERGIDVALKLLNKGDPTALYRFKQEFRALADVAHPNLVEYYELAAFEDQWFLTMEYIDGVDFLSYVREGEGDFDAVDEPSEHSFVGDQPGGGSEWEEDTAVTRTGTHMPQRYMLRHPAQFDRLRRALEQLVEGVVALHEAGHLHRDIKPSNILVDRDGRLALLDFGVVTELARQGRGGDGGDQIVGTPAYMAPEQSAGEALSQASDWYSVGVVLYEALTGGRPFGGSVRSSLEARSRFDPPAPSTFAPGVPDDLDELCRLLLERDPAARPGGDEVLRRLGIRRSISMPIDPRAKTSVQLVGRAPHLAALKSAFEEACRGRSHAVLVHGAAGMGKTALIQAFLADVSRERRAVVLEGRCYEHESMPYKALDPVVDALSRYLLSLSARDVEAVMPDDVAAIARLFPVLRRVEAVVGGAAPLTDKIDAADLRRRAVDALRALIGKLAAQRPLVLYIDDLQWGDTDSAVLIRELLRPPQTPGLLFLASYRSEDARTAPFLRALLPLPSVPIELAVEALNSAESLVVAESLLGGVSAILPTIGRSIARESGGNPFFVHELVRYVQAESFSDMSLGTITLEEVIRVRLSELPPAARRLLDVTAVAGHPLSTATARRATELGGELDSAVHLLRARKLIRTRSGAERGAGSMEPYHDRIREVAVSLLTEDELREVHRCLAVALSVEAEPDPEALADHFQGAGDLDRAAQYCARAAAQASRAVAFDRAAALYRRALDMRSYAPADEALLRADLARALGDAGKGKEAAEIYLDAASKAPAADALGYRRLAGEHLLRSGHIDAGIEIIDAVIRELGLRVPRSRSGTILSILWHRLRLRLGGVRYTERDASEIAPAELSRLDACWSASTGLAMVDTFGSVNLQTRHLQLALRAGERRRLARALAVEAAYVSTRGTSVSSRVSRLVGEAYALCDGLEHDDVRGLVRGIEGLTAFQQGRFRDALGLCENAVDVLRAHGAQNFFEQTSIELYSLWCLYYLGEVGEVAERIPVLLREAQSRGDLYSATNFVTGLPVSSWLVRDEVDAIRQRGRATIDRWSHRDYHLQHYWYMLGSLMIELYAGDADAVARIYREHWPAYASSQMHRIELVHHEAMSLECRVLLVGGRATSDSAMLGRARKLARRLRKRGLPYAIGWSYLTEAAVARSHADDDDAVRCLVGAEEAFTRAEMAMHAAAARWRRAEILGGDAGADLARRARAHFTERGVVAPASFLRLLAPGFDS